MKKFSVEMNEFLAEYNKAVAAIDAMAGLVEEHQEIKDKLAAEGCYEETYYNEFNVLDYIVKMYKSVLR